MTDLIRIKSTQSVEMFYDEEEKILYISMVQEINDFKQIAIPMSKAFQVQRGLLSAIQRYHRRKVKK